MLDISKAISNNAYMVFSKIPDLPFYIKTLQIPTLSQGQTTIPFPQHHNWIVPSVHQTIEEINIMWYLDENFRTYFELLNWSASMRVATDITTVMSDATVIIMNNAKQPIININFIDAWITSLGPLDFDTFSNDPIVPFMMLSCNQIEWEYRDGSMKGKI